MKWNVHVLVTCSSEENLPLSLLVFDTIRVGFPTAEILVTLNRGLEWREEIKRRTLAVGGKFYLHQFPKEHGDYIAAVIATEETPTVFVDTDMIFWENCEDIVLPEGKLYGGRLIPELHECGARMPARIHPSLLFVPDPAALCAALAPFHKKFWYFRPFQGYSYLGPEGAVTVDTCASLYGALPDAAYAFGAAELDRYEHLFGGTYPERFKEMGMSEPLARELRMRHQLARSKSAGSRELWRNLRSIQGLSTLEQGQPLPGDPEPTPAPPVVEAEKAKPAHPSWRYWSGVLEENGLPAFGVMHAQFEATPGVPAFCHTLIVDIARGQVLVAGDEPIELSPFFPLILDAKAHETPEGQIHESDTVRISNATLTLGEHAYTGLSGTFWYEREERPVVPGEGWRWIGIHLFDGTDLMLYDRSHHPRRYARRWREEEWVSPTAAKITECDGGWDVGTWTQTYSLVPVVPKQEITDEARGLKYTEALCRVYKPFNPDSGELDRGGRRQVGWAFVEIVPAIGKAEGRSKPTESEMHKRWANGNQDAADLIDYFGYATQLADDLVDLDTPNVETKLKRSAVMADLLYVVLYKIPGNRFFRENEAHFAPLFVNGLVTWDASNEWAESDSKTTRQFAYVLRETTARLVEHVAFLVGGFQFSKQVAREIHDYYHGAMGIESFEKWDQEGGA